MLDARVLDGHKRWYCGAATAMTNVGRKVMPVFTRPDAEIHYEVHGSGYALLLFAPGGLRSQLAFWRHSPSNPDAAPCPACSPQWEA